MFVPLECELQHSRDHVCAGSGMSSTQHRAINVIIKNDDSPRNSKKNWRVKSSFLNVTLNLINIESQLNNKILSCFISYLLFEYACLFLSSVLLKLINSFLIVN